MRRRASLDGNAPLISCTDQRIGGGEMCSRRPGGILFEGVAAFARCRMAATMAKASNDDC